MPMNSRQEVQESGTVRKLSEQERLQYSKQIKTVRLSKGMSQADLAEAANVGRGTIINIETGKTIPQGEVLVRIMRALDMVADEGEHVPEWVQGNLAIIAKMLVRVPEDRRADVLSGIFSAIIKATPSE